MGIGRGNNPNSRKNLIPIKKGEVRNPQGQSQKVRDRIERRNRLEDFKRRHEHHEVQPFTQEEALAWYEYFQGLSTEALTEVSRDKELPFGALKILKFVRSDFQEGADRNTDKMERRYYGSRNNVDVSASIESDEGISLANLGLVFGGEMLEPEGDE